jgi:lipopolysaccharide biosynthesis regulator YciM
LTPIYIDAGKTLRLAKKKADEKDFNAAIQLYNKAIVAVPTSNEARISATIALFTAGGIENNKHAVELLEGIKLQKEDLKRISAVIPQEYYQYLEPVKR